MEFPIDLTPKTPSKTLSDLEGKTVNMEIENGFEGGATFERQGRIVSNAQGEHVFKEGTAHTFNLSKYISNTECLSDRYLQVDKARIMGIQ